MDRANIIHDLLNWIENHLDQPLLLDNVAAKSGYSKWHLQRMFPQYHWPCARQLYPRAPFVQGRTGTTRHAASHSGYRPAVPF
ncbi:Right origin-binding protein [Serratia fonticola]|uniref:Right origin-binding protein n=1 Tax=Serratia fonticola TaxID=47917 RepID=A0A4U9TEZ4_SERFO|nr:Right origin-binding protein [Serratia fonticola]